MFSASSETRDRNAPTNANQIRLQTSRIRQEHRPIRYQLPARLSFRQGQAGLTHYLVPNWVRAVAVGTAKRLSFLRRFADGAGAHCTASGRLPRRCREWPLLAREADIRKLPMAGKESSPLADPAGLPRG